MNDTKYIRKTSLKSGLSRLISPMSYLMDLILLVLPIWWKVSLSTDSSFSFTLFVVVVWSILSFYTYYYQVERFTKWLYIVRLLFRQILLFAVLCFAFVGYWDKFSIPRVKMVQYLIWVVPLLSIFRLLLSYVIKRYRAALGKNLRKVVVVGDNTKVDQLVQVFKKCPEFGYAFQKKFCVRHPNFSLEACKQYIIKNNIHEIYCSIAELSNEQLKQLTIFSDNHLKKLKFIPDNKDIFAKKLAFHYYDYIPVLSLREIALEHPLNTYMKRAVDIIFALTVIFGILSWLTPIIFIWSFFEKDAKGPLFYKQKRNGIGYKEFYCYKFRSMKVNNSIQQAKKGDSRITKMGAILRKTSIDELPQFYNVLKGEMSVVGPRPHMVKHNEDFAKRVNRFMVRHYVKPGITGLAQVSGFRGEIETEKDIINRVKYDIFYIENWSFLLDIKIIFLTVYNAVVGDKKAY